MDLALDKKVALVTAASKGLGLAAATALSQEGAKVVICSRDADRLREAAASMPGEVHTVVADVTDPVAPARLVDEAVTRFGGLDILVANAAGPPKTRALDTTDEGMFAAINANFLASVRLVQAATPLMRDSGWGRICLITSDAVKQPIPDLAYSNSARTALWAWTKTASQDLIDSGVTLNLICPGYHSTDRIKELGYTGRMGDPDDFGKIVAFLCSQAAGFVSGAALQVNGASTLGLL